MPRIGLVLGGGGMVGQAYHAGALAALERVHGWDARDAEIIVGTSAGSLTGAFLRRGVSASDLAAWWSDVPASPAMLELSELIGERPIFEPLRWIDMLRMQPSSLRSCVTAAQALVQRRVRAAGLALSRASSVDVLEHLGFVDVLQGSRWPARSLWVCVVRRRDGERIVLGQPDTPTATLRSGIAASCAVPGYFSPVRIDGDEYVDGGAYTPTNADVLAESELDFAVVVAPMSARGPVQRNVSGGLRRVIRRMLNHEVATLRDHGIPTLAIEPGPPAQRAMGGDLMANAVLGDVARAAFLDTRVQLVADESSQELVAVAAAA